MKLWFVLFLLWPQFLWANGTLCLDAARNAARSVGVPLEVMAAITLLETGRSRDGQVEPWPWAINHAGAGQWLDSRQDAQRAIDRLLEQGERNFDVGCFQINWRWHGENVGSPSDFLNPTVSANYAATFLRRLYDDLGDWSAAAGAYHSQTPEYAQRYRTRFEAILAGLPDRPASSGQTRSNSFPLFRSGSAGRMGSLFPADS